MSYILDALRKSERERSLGAVPDLGTAQQERSITRASRWPWLVGALILLNLAIGSAFFLREPAPVVVAQQPIERPEQEPAVADTPSVPVNGAEHELASRPNVPPAARVTSNDALLPSNINKPEPASTSLARVETLEIEPEKSTPVRALRAESPIDYPLEPSPGAAEWMDMPADFRARVSRPDIDVHVYSDQPARRFVLIDLRKYREGERTDAGLEIQSITQAGVIFSDNGTLFQVKRP